MTEHAEIDDGIISLRGDSIPETQVVVRDASLGYEGRTVTEGLNFGISAGDYLCILGENGSGKSTLIKALLGLKPQMSGEIEWYGGLSGKDVGYLPQQTVVQRDFPASVREIVRSGCLSGMGWRPYYKKEEKQLAEEKLERLGIQDLGDRCYRDLSGGQQQRVLLARALCAAKKMLLLDEPVTGLDPKAQNDLYELIEGLHREGITIIMVSHDVNAALRYASHILHIGSQRQLFFGTKEDYLQSEIGEGFIASQGGGQTV